MEVKACECKLKEEGKNHQN